MSLRLQLRSAMSLRGAFIIQIIGMVLNNSALIMAWFFFFDYFGVVNGWRAEELVGAMGVSMFVFGIVMLFSRGITELPRIVDNGTLDSMLTKPQPILSQLATNTMDPSVFGDILMGAVIIAWYFVISSPSIMSIFVFIISILVAMIAFWCFTILLPSTLAFYVFDADRLSKYVGALFMDAATYPSGILTGPIRMFLLFILPGLLMSGVPIEVIHSYGWREATLGIVIAVFWLLVSLRIFSSAIKRYESSNLIGAR